MPRPAGWTARFPRLVGSEGPAGLRPPQRGEVLFITSWSIFNATLASARLVRGKL